MRLRFFLLLSLSLYGLSQASLAQDTSAQPVVTQEALPSQKSVRPAKKPAATVQQGRKEAPTVITADKVEAKLDQTLEATGDARLQKSDQSVRADHMLYKQNSSELFADGSVKFEQPGTILTGPSFQLNLNNNTGEMAQPMFTFTDAKVRGSADEMHIQGKQQYNFEHGIYTSCPVGNDDWLLRMGELDLDRKTQIGTAYNARVEFMGVPILYTPWMDFPLNDQRRSGLLGPVLGTTSKGGREITLPFYWNIASNYDATITPRFIEKRGMLLDNEFRYMGGSYSGSVQYGELRDDRVAQLTRTHTSLLHVQNFGGGVTGSLNLNEAGDDAYFRDLSSDPAIATQKQLLREGALSYSGGGWSASVRAQSYQTLQDPNAPTPLPYRRLPQVNVGTQRVIGGAIATFNAEYVNFNHPSSINGSRVVLNPTIAYPLVSDPAYYITPKMGLHSTQYSLGDNNPGTDTQYTRNLPIFSVDSGMTLERDFSAYDSAYVQTLEPRVYYVNIPYANQDQLPNFDTAPAAFSFMQMFTENRFIGSDRIGDADQVTAALTSRLLDGETGNELLRVALGERFSRQTPRVTLGAPSSTTNQSDILLGVSGRMSKSIMLDSLLQYNPNETRTEMFSATAHYWPEAGKVFNLGYRYTFSADPVTTPTLKQVDLSTQWLLTGRWHTVGELKYSLQDGRTVEALAGLEYNQDCWAVRMVAQQFVTALRETSTSYFIQLELYEMLRIGDDPLAALKQSVPGYTILSDKNRKTGQNQP